MAESSTRNWTELECLNCAGTSFIRPFGFIKHPTQGTTEKPLGIVCLTCGHDSDPGTMTRRMELNQRAKELAELQAQSSRIEAEQQALSDALLEADPVEVREVVVRRARATKEQAAAKKKRVTKKKSKPS